MKKQTDAQKKQLENDLRDCMKCKFLGGMPIGAYIALV